MDEYTKPVKEIIDQDKYYSLPGPAPSSELLNRKPTEQMLWHLRHKPYEIGGDTDAGRAENRE